MSTAQQEILRFWLLTLLFALFWSFLVAALGHKHWFAFMQAPQKLALSVYVLGLYLWLSALCWQIHQRFKHDPWFKTDFTQARLQFLLGALTSCFILIILGLVFFASGAIKTLNVPLNPFQSLHIALEVSLMALCIALIEEAVFRGLMLDLFEQDMKPEQALRAQALLFASLHMIRGDLPWLQWLAAFGALYFTGLIAGQLRQASGRLWAPIGLHAAWVWLCVVLERLQWISWQPEQEIWSGMGNPAYALSGALFLSLSYFFLRHYLYKTALLKSTH